ncbi:MAG TPA: DUF3857 domain-containing protein [Chitinophagales bacterium]|nr:DUF3857 domain-containing protein [Chitinophagales bacterium]
MQNFIYCLLFISLSVESVAYPNTVQPVYLNYDWAIEPTKYSFSQEQPTTILKNYKLIEYTYNSKGDLTCYETTHKIVYIDNDLALETFNKVYIPVTDTAALVRIKARSISQDGKITNFNRNSIKSINNEEIGTYNIFAIEGAEKKGIIEYLYTTRTENIDLYGREWLQSDYPTQNTTIEIISPPNLLFEAKSYNGFPQPTITETDSVRILKAQFAEMPPLTEETYSTPRANYMRIDYKLSYNQIPNTTPKRLFDWQMASKHFGGLVSEKQDKATTTLIANTLKTLKLKKLSQEDKIIAIEEYLKNTIAVQQNSPSASVATILHNQYANEVGICRTFAAFFQTAQIPYQIVITSDRTRCRFDAEFEAWNSFTDILFYFPQTKKFIVPNIFVYRYGNAPEHFANNHGLFITPNTYTNTVQLIPTANSKDNLSTIAAQVDFTDILTPKVRFQQEWAGYRAITMRAAYNFQKETLLNALATSSIEDTHPTDIVINNDAMKNNAYPDKLFGITATFSIKSLIEKAGDNYLFKVGELIGAQTELYQNHERQNPIDMDYPITYSRSITFEIPKGYALKGLEDTRIDHSVEENGQKINRFESGYSLKANQVTIFANEYYEKTHLPKESYDNFRKVINAAADFNKIVLVFEKQP